jgi:hypothetical protein
MSIRLNTELYFHLPNQNFELSESEQPPLDYVNLENLDCSQIPTRSVQLTIRKLQLKDLQLSVQPNSLQSKEV